MQKPELPERDLPRYAEAAPDTPGSSPYPASREHGPLSGLDEFLIHNAPYPVRVMWTPDAQAYERVWFTCQDKVGELLVVIGLAFYPNLGTAEAFAIVNVRGNHHITVRAHNVPILSDRMEMTIGPFHFEVVEPFRRWRLFFSTRTSTVIAYDITWLDTKWPVFRQLGAGIIVGGRAVSPVAGYDGFGRQEGRVEVPRRTLRLWHRLHSSRDAGPSLGHPLRCRRSRSLHGDAAPAQRRVGRVRRIW